MKQTCHYKIEFLAEGDGNVPLPIPPLDAILDALADAFKRHCPSVEAILPGMRARVSSRARVRGTGSGHGRGQPALRLAPYIHDLRKDITAVDLSTAKKRMGSIIHHVRCDECNACQEYLIDPPSAPLCRLAFALAKLGGKDPVRIRRLQDCERRGLVGRVSSKTGRWHLTGKGLEVIHRAISVSRAVQDSS